MRYLLVLLLLTTGCTSKPKLHIFCWNDFISNEVITEFEQAFNCQIVIDAYDSNEAMYTKLKSGATGYDLLFPTHYYVTLLSQEKLLAPFNPQLMPNLKNIDWSDLTRFGFESSNYYVPYMLSYTGIGYNVDKVSAPPTSWHALSDPAYKKRVTLLQDYREVLGAALCTLGYSVNTVDPDQLEEAYNIVLTWKKNIAKFENEQYTQALASGEYFLAHGYSTYIAQVMLDTDKVSFSLPQEGGIVTLDAIALSKDAREVELAHAFVNALLGVPAAALNFRKIQAKPPIIGLPYSKEELANPALFPPEEAVSKSQVIFDLGPSVELYHAIWNRILQSL